MFPYLIDKEHKDKVFKINQFYDLYVSKQVFFGIDLEDIVKGLRKQFPYSFSGLHDDVNDFPSLARGRRRKNNTRIL
jgi:hypothetical protein